MTNHVQWDPDFDVGHELIDAQHRGLLAQCRLLADHFGGAQAEPAPQRFDEALDRLKALVREHFESEALLLAGGSLAALEDHQAERNEFEYLAGEIATTENFDRQEVQRYFCLWCWGHITGSATALRALLVDGAGSHQA
jgi:hemerythrin-like metal-binding protein